MTVLNSLLAQFGYYKNNQQPDLSKVNKVEFSKVSIHLDRNTRHESSIYSNPKGMSNKNNSGLGKRVLESDSSKNDNRYNQLKEHINFGNPFELAEIADYVEVTHLENQIPQNDLKGFYVDTNGIEKQISRPNAYAAKDYKSQKILNAYASEKYRTRGNLVNIVV